jgi:hypothetical protein
MSLFVFAAPIQPEKTAEFRQYVANLGDGRREEYEASREEAGIRQEAIFLQQTPLGEMVVIVQDADNEADALGALREMRDPANAWYFQRMKDTNGADVVGSDVPANELLLDCRPGVD